MTQLLLVLLLTALITPAAFLQNQQTDREARALKGNVKSVEGAVAQIDNSSGRAASTRQRTNTEEFDAAGNLTVEKWYDSSGAVTASLKYSYLDGERVVKEETKGKRPARDPRYTAKLKYKYDSNGKRIESAHVFSDGSVPTRQVYTFTANAREELHYSAGGSLAYKYLHKFDDKGNELETVTTRYVGARDPLQVTTTYTYLEFDPQGNWIRRKESRDGDSWMIYRTITYH